MRLVDTRPPFAGLANLSEGALASLPTPAICWTKPSCAATAKSCWGSSSGRAAGSCWRRKLSLTSTSTRFSRPASQALRPAASTRAVWARKSCPRRRTTSSAPPTGWTSSTSFWITPTTSCSTPRPSWQSSALRPRRRARASVCASTRSVPRRKAMQFTTPAPRAAALAPPAPSGMPPCRQTRPYPNYWTDCTSTPCANRMPMHWP